MVHVHPITGFRKGIFLIQQGTMLLLLDQKIDGVIRERLLISCLRYKGITFPRPIKETHHQRDTFILYSWSHHLGQTELENVDGVAKLIERTGYVAVRPRPVPQYPERFFARGAPPTRHVHFTHAVRPSRLPDSPVGLLHKDVKMIIGRLRSDDIYHQLPSYPVPEHRSIALATQASMLYVCLFFAPKLLYTAYGIFTQSYRSTSFPIYAESSARPP